MKKKFTVRGYTIYLAVLLAVVLVYLLVAVPRFSAEATAMTTEKQLLQTETQMLARYETQLTDLSRKIEEQYALYEKDTRLSTPVSFADELYAAAHGTDCVLVSMSIAEGGETEAISSQREVYTAVLQVAVPKGTSPVQFIRAIENLSGAGYFVLGIGYEPTVRTAEQGAAQTAPIGADMRGVNTPQEQPAYMEALGVEDTGAGMQEALYDFVDITVQMTALVK